MAIFGHLFLDSHRFLFMLLLFLRPQGHRTQENAGSCVSPKPPTADECKFHIQEAIRGILEEHGIESKDESHPIEEAAESATDEHDEHEDEEISEPLEESEESTEEDEEEEDGEELEHEERDDEEAKDSESEKDQEEEIERTVGKRDVEEEEETEEHEAKDEEIEEPSSDLEEEDVDEEDTEEMEEQTAEHEEEETTEMEEEKADTEEEDEVTREEVEEGKEGKQVEEEEEEEEEEEDEHEKEEEGAEEEEEEEQAKEEESAVEEEEEEGEEEEEEEAEEKEEAKDEEEELEKKEHKEEEEEEEEEEVKEKEEAEEEEEEGEEEEEEEPEEEEDDESKASEQDVKEETEEQEVSESQTEEGESEESVEEEEHDKSPAEETSQKPEKNETTTDKDAFDRTPEEPSEEAYIIGAGMAQELPTQDSEADQPAAEEEKSTEEEEEEELSPKEEDDTDELDSKEEEEEAMKPKEPLRNRDHIDELLGLNEIGTQYDKEDQAFIQKILDELKKIYENAVKPLEMIYKFRDISTRLLGDAEIYAKPLVLFVGPWSSGKSSVINFLLSTERTSAALKTGPEPTDVDFTLIEHGDVKAKMTGSELATDWEFSSVQKFGQSFLEHFKGIHFPHRLLKKLTLVDTPGIMENRKPQDRGYPFNDALQWFIDRADVIYVVLDPTKLEIGSELESVLDQLKGREAQIRFILNKADTIRRSDIMRVIGQLFWNLSPLMGSSEAPVIYAVSLMTKPFHPGSPAKFLLDQEMTFLSDLRETIDKRVENRILYARRHAVRVRNHAKMVDCYLSTYYKHKSIFSNRKKIADQITENPDRYSIYQGLSTLTNVSRYDLPDPDIYREFFNLHPLYDFKPLQSTCSYFRGCPLDKLDIAISYDLPDLLKKYKKRFSASSNSEEKSR